MTLTPIERRYSYNPGGTTPTRTPPPPSVSNPTQQSNPWQLRPIKQRDTSQGDPLQQYADAGVELTPAMRTQLMVGQEPPIDYGNQLENRAIADESKGLFLGSAWFDRTRDSAVDGWRSSLGMDPYTYTNSGLNVQGKMDGETYGFNFWRGGPPAEKSPAADLYMLYQRGQGGPDSTRAYLQQLLFSAGLVTRDNPVPAMGWGDPFDKQYDDAWKVAVHESMKTGIPVMVLLRDREAYFNANGGLPGTGKRGNNGRGGGGGPRRPTASIISEEDARSIVDQVSKEQLGRKLTGDEEKLATSIVKAVRDKMSSEANAAIDQQMAGGGTVSRTTDPRVTSTNELESREPAETAAYDLAAAFANLVGISTGGGM